MIIGYARVSADGQHSALNTQRSKQRALSGSSLRRSSGAVSDRKALAALEAGDVSLVAKLDRLARSTRDLLNTLAAIADRGAALAGRSLG